MPVAGAIGGSGRRTLAIRHETVRPEASDPHWLAGAPAGTQSRAHFSKQAAARGRDPSARSGRSCPDVAEAQNNGLRPVGLQRVKGRYSSKQARLKRSVGVSMAKGPRVERHTSRRICNVLGSKVILNVAATDVREPEGRAVHRGSDVHLDGGRWQHVRRRTLYAWAEPSRSEAARGKEGGGLLRQQVLHKGATAVTDP